MEREALWYLTYLVEKIHTTVLATVDEAGLPVTAAIDMMDADEGGLYFLTARGKSLCDRLLARSHVALTGMRGEDTMSSVAVSVRGRVEEVGPGYLPRLFAKNPYMEQIYPSEASREALTVFRVCDGTGEWFDLSRRPIERAGFSFGGAQVREEEGYLITEACVGCGACVEVCPQDCIRADTTPFVIERDHCLRCGRCLDACGYGSVRRLG